MRTVQFRFENVSTGQLVEFSERARQLAAEMGLEIYDESAPRAFIVRPRSGTIDQSGIATIKLYRDHMDSGLLEAKRAYEGGRALFRVDNAEELQKMIGQLRAAGVQEDEIQILSSKELLLHEVHNS